MMNGGEQRVQQQRQQQQQQQTARLSVVNSKLCLSASTP